MIKKILFLTVALLTSQAHANQLAKVISSTPIYEKIPVIQTECTKSYIEEPIYSYNPNNAMVGAIAGGLIGSVISPHSGKNAAIGALGGAIIGSQIKSHSHSQYIQKPVANCQDITHYQNKMVGYEISYLLNGIVYSTTTNTYPGSYIEVNESPVYTPYNATVYVNPPIPIYVRPVYPHHRHHYWH